MSGGNWKDLLKAVEIGDVARTRYHLGLGVDPNFQHPEYFTAPIFEAIREGHLEVVKILLEEGGANPELIEELTGDSPIDTALSNKQFEVLRYLNTKLPTSMQYTLRHVLVTCGNSKSGKDICQELLSKGHRVTFMCSSSTEALAIKNDLYAATKNPHIDYVLVGDFDSIESVRVIANDISKKYQTVDTLIHTLCVWPTTLTLTDDGLEYSFMINYLVRHIFNMELMPILEQRNSHIIYVTPDIWPYQIPPPDLNQTPFGRDFHWKQTLSKTVTYGVMSFLNLVKEERKHTRVTATLIHAGGSVQNATTGSSNESCISRAIRMIEQLLFWNKQQETLTFSESLDFLSQPPADANHNLHSKIFSGSGADVMFDKTNLKELEQWTFDLLSRSRGMD